MIDKHAAELDALIEDEATSLGLKNVSYVDRDHDNRVRLKKLDECTLTLVIHRDQQEQVLDCLRSGGVEAFPEEDAVSDRWEYFTVYIPTLHPETDIIRYQKVLDNAQ